MQTWSALPRKTGVSLPYRLDPERNRVPGHNTVAEHVASVFEFVSRESRAMKIEVISIGDSVEDVTRYLRENWTKWAGKIDAVAVGSGNAWLGEDVADWDGDFADFWARVRDLAILSLMFWSKLTN